MINHFSATGLTGALILSMPKETEPTPTIVSVATTSATSLLSLIIPGRVGNSNGKRRRRRSTTQEQETILKEHFCDKISHHHNNDCSIQNCVEVTVSGSSFIDFLIILSTASSSTSVVTDLKTINENIATTSGGKFKSGVIHGKYY